MSMPLAATRSSISFQTRLVLFVLMAIAGLLGGYGWSLEVSDIPYDAMLGAFLEPGFQVASLSLAVVLGFTLGFAHIVRICYLPAAVAMMPFLEAAKDKRELARISAVLIVSMVLVCALWGVIVGMPAAALAGTVGSRRIMGMIMQPALIIMGLAMLLIAAGELGLIRRLLPDFHFPEKVAQGASARVEQTSHRPVLILGISIAATFGIICNRPLYIALLVYVAVVGGMGYGALTLGAYGLGLSSSLVVAGLLLIPAGRLARLMAWLADREEGLHVIQGLAFTFMGALSVGWFVLRHITPPA